MKSLKSMLQSLALVAFVTTGSTLGAHAQEAQPVSVKPLQVFHVSVGAKRALGYYLAEAGTCDLTVLLSDVSYPDDGIIPSASRVGVKVAGGTSAKVDTVDGRTIAFSCAARAEEMTVSVFERLAYSPAAQR